MRCAYDEDEKRWETEIEYERTLSVGGVSFKVSEKARLFVQMVNSDDFYAHVDKSGKITASQVIKPTNSSHGTNFVMHAIKFGFEKSDLGRTLFLATGTTKYQIVGIDLKARKKKVMVEGPTGCIRRISVQDAKDGLNRFNTRL
jgi:argonaute-like protein implicated in RNA metabolism and viral defense